MENKCSNCSFGGEFEIKDREKTNEKTEFPSMDLKEEKTKETEE
jgi:hypothetical protein